MTLQSRKVCLLGDFAVGKTSAVERGVHGTYTESYSTTVGVRIHSRSVDVMDGEPLRLSLWEVPGSGKFDRTRTAYVTDAQGLALVADGTRLETIDEALLLRRQAEDVIGKRLPCILLLNKCDLASRWEVTPAMLQALSEHLPVFVISARTGSRVENAFRGLAGKLSP